MLLHYLAWIVEYSLQLSYSDSWRPLQVGLVKLGAVDATLIFRGADSRFVMWSWPQYLIGPLLGQEVAEEAF